MAHSLTANNQYPDSNTTSNAGDPVNFAVTVNATATALALGIITGGANARVGDRPNIGGVNFSQANAAQKAATSPEAVAELWYLTDPPTGAVTIAIPNTNTNNIHAYLFQFAAQANYTSRYSTANGANATSTNPSVDITTTGTGTVAAMVACDGLANCITGFSNQSGTSVFKSDLGSYGGGMQWVNQVNAGALTISYTANSDDWGAVAVAFNEQAKILANVAQTLGETAITANGTVANAAANFTLAASGNIPANANTATTAQLTAPANKTTNDFGAGWIADDTNPLPAVNTTANQYTELEWCIAAGAGVTTNHVYTWRVTINGTAVNTYAANATWTIGTTVSNANVTQTLATTTGAATGAVGVAGSVSQTLAATAPTSTGTVAVTATVSQTLGATTPTVTASAPVTATVSQTLASTDPTGTATVAVAAGVQQTLADASLSAAATVLVAGTTAQTLADTTLEASGTVAASGDITASVDQTLADTTVESSAALGPAPSDGTVSQTLAETVPTATATVAVTATLAQTLGATSPTATAGVQVTATLAQTLAVTTASATAGAQVKASTAQTLADTGRTITGTVAVKGTTAQTLGATTLAATGAVGTTSPLVLANSTYISANAATATTGQLTPPSGKTVNADFQAGKVSDDTNPLPSLDLVTNRYTELEWALKATTFALNAGVYSFRVTANGTAVNTYSVTPTLTYRVPITANVAQTLANTALTANAVQADVGAANATVTQTLQNLGQSISTVTGRAATVDSTLGSVSQPRLRCDTSALVGGTPTGYNFYFGRSSGTTDTIVPVAYEANLTVLLATIAPGLGAWYVRVRAYNADGEAEFSNEVFVVVPAFTVSVTNPQGNATVSQTLGTTAAASAGKVAVTATVAQTLAETTTGIVGAGTVSTTVAQTLGAVSGTSTATVETHGDVTQTLAETGCAATGTVYNPAVSGTIEQTLDDTGIAASAVSGEIGPIIGWVDAVLADATATVDTDVLIAAAVDETLAETGCAAQTVPGRVQHDDNILIGRRR